MGDLSGEGSDPGTVRLSRDRGVAGVCVSEQAGFLGMVGRPGGGVRSLETACWKPPPHFFFAKSEQF